MMLSFKGQYLRKIPLEVFSCNSDKHWSSYHEDYITYPSNFCQLDQFLHLYGTTLVSFTLIQERVIFKNR